MPSIHEKRDCISEFLQQKFLCLLFLRDNNPAYEISLEQVEFTGRKPLNLAIEFASLIIAITSKYFSRLLYLNGVLEFRKHIFSSKIVYHELPEFDASTPSESAVAPKSNSVEFGSAHEWSGVWIRSQGSVT